MSKAFELMWKKFCLHKRFKFRNQFWNQNEIFFLDFEVKKTNFIWKIWKVSCEKKNEDFGHIFWGQNFV